HDIARRRTPGFTRPALPIRHAWTDWFVARTNLGLTRRAIINIAAVMVGKPLFSPGEKATQENKLRDNGVKGDEDTLIGGRQGALTGSIFSEEPTLLVEMVFLTKCRMD